MGKITGIAWTNHTFNPWWGCVKVNDGCAHCYAEAWDKRTGGEHWGKNAERRFFGDKHWNEPRLWNRDAEKAGERRRVFCSSMADVFEDREDLRPQRLRLWQLIRDTPWLDWLLLTKRPQNISHLLPQNMGPWPWKNVWLGMSVPTQDQVVEIEILKAVPAVVHFLSVEPLLTPLLLGAALHDCDCMIPEQEGAGQHAANCKTFKLHGIDWVIIGGESGGKPRPFLVEWARSLIEECRNAGVAPFMKQLGANPMRESTAFEGLVKLQLLDKKHGGDPAEWPADLRVQEFPTPRHAP